MALSFFYNHFSSRARYVCARCLLFVLGFMALDGLAAPFPGTLPPLRVPLFAGHIPRITPVAVRIERVQPNLLQLLAGSNPVVMTLFGQSLETISTVRLMHHGQPVTSARLHLGPTHSGRRALSLSTTGSVRPGSGYRIEVKAGQHHIVLPVRIIIRPAPTAATVKPTAVSSSRSLLSAPHKLQRLQPTGSFLRFRRPLTLGERVLQNHLIRVRTARPMSLRLVPGGPAQVLELLGDRLDRITGLQILPARGPLQGSLKSISSTRLVIAIQAPTNASSETTYRLQLLAGTVAIYTPISLSLTQAEAQPSPVTPDPVILSDLRLQPSTAFPGDTVTGTLSFSRTPEQPVVIDLTSDNPAIPVPQRLTARTQRNSFSFTMPTGRVQAGAITIRATISGHPPSLAAQLQLLPLPKILDFHGKNATLYPGQSLTLYWQTRHADTVYIEKDGKTVAEDLPPTGEYPVQPRQATEYTLVASSEGRHPVTARVIADLKPAHLNLIAGQGGFHENQKTQVQPVLYGLTPNDIIASQPTDFALTLNQPDNTSGRVYLEDGQWYYQAPVKIVRTRTTVTITASLKGDPNVHGSLPLTLIYTPPKLSIDQFLVNGKTEDAVVSSILQPIRLSWQVAHASRIEILRQREQNNCSEAKKLVYQGTQEAGDWLDKKIPENTCQTMASYLYTLVAYHKNWPDVAQKKQQQIRVVIDYNGFLPGQLQVSLGREASFRLQRLHLGAATTLIPWRDLQWFINGEPNNLQTITQNGLVSPGMKGSFLYRAPLQMPTGQSLTLVAVDKNSRARSILPISFKTGNELQIGYSYTVENSSQCVSVPDIPGCKKIFSTIYGQTTVYPSYDYPLNNLALDCTLTGGTGRIEACDRVTDLKHNRNGITVHALAQPGQPQIESRLFAHVRLGLKGYPEIPGTQFCVARCSDLRIDQIQPLTINRGDLITVTGEGLDRLTAVYLGGFEYSKLSLITVTSNRLTFRANLFPKHPWQGPITILTSSGQLHTSQQIVSLIPANP